MKHSSVFIVACLLLAWSCSCLARSLTLERALRRTDAALEAYREKQELYRCHGMNEEECEMQKILLAELRQRIAVATGQTEHRETEVEVNDDQALDGCIILTVEQLSTMLDNFDQTFNESSNEGSRKKRGLVDFKKQPSSKWTMPIRYRFDGDHDTAERQIIRNAVQHWMDNTCLSFTELPDNEQPSYQHILVTSQQGSCYSYIGKVGLQTPFQQLNLGDACLSRFGTPVHEFGHALGLWHEQMRADRDDWITVLWDNIVPSSNYKAQFTKQVDNTDPLGVPYDYGSVMQYASIEGVSVNGKDTMVAKNPLYQMNMGQRTGLSFNNIKVINRAYCADSCTGRSLAMPCQYGGYQNPKDCSRCMCPDGLAGDFCEKVAPSRNARCGGETILTESFSKTTIMSPGYEEPGNYMSFQECSWWFKAPVGYKLKMSFDGFFGMYCQNPACYHWVEVKYKADIGQEGARFCCYRKPEAIITSESNELLVVFKSNYSLNVFSAQRGFKALISLEKDAAATNRMPVTSSPGTNRLPATSPPGLNWQCSFEPVGSEDPFCGIAQDSRDHFDWTLTKDPTPSDPTGPDAAFDKSYYVFIEASNPRKPNDQARLILPEFNGFSGDACVRFAYHMYGFHVRELKLAEMNKGSTDAKDLWSRKGEMGNVWRQDAVNVFITSGKQLVFIGVRGDEYSGDIALDAIRVTSGKCA